jgi:hypothetical protein
MALRHKIEHINRNTNLSEDSDRFFDISSVINRFYTYILKQLQLKLNEISVNKEYVTEPMSYLNFSVAKRNAINITLLKQKVSKQVATKQTEQVNCK